MKGQQGTPFSALSCRGRAHVAALHCGELLLTQRSDVLPRKASRRPGVVLGTGIVAVLGTRTEQPQSHFLSSRAFPSPRGPKPAGQGQQPLALAPLRVEGASSCCAVACACVTNLRSEHLFVLFLLSPLHPPLSVCQNTNGPLLGPCHLVSIRCHSRDHLPP